MAEVVSTNQFKNGMHIEHKGSVWRIVEFQHVKPGKGGAFVRTKLKNIDSGAVVEDHVPRRREARGRAPRDEEPPVPLRRRHRPTSWTTTRTISPASRTRTSRTNRVQGAVEDRPDAARRRRAVSDPAPASVELEIIDTEPGLQGRHRLGRHQACDARDRRGRPGPAVRQLRRADQSRPTRAPLHLARLTTAWGNPWFPHEPPPSPLDVAQCVWPFGRPSRPSALRRFASVGGRLSPRSGATSLPSGPGEARPLRSRALPLPPPGESARGARRVARTLGRARREPPGGGEERAHGDERLDELLVVRSVGGDGSGLPARVAPDARRRNETGEIPFEWPRAGVFRGRATAARRRSGSRSRGERRREGAAASPGASRAQRLRLAARARATLGRAAHSAARPSRLVGFG